MSLLDEWMEDFVVMDRRTSSDGYGGYIVEWADGATFNAAAVLDTSMEARIGEKQGVTALYTITTGREMNLQYHDVIRRASDNKIFRVTSDGDDKKTPRSATLNMRQVSAEEWSLPDGQMAGS